MEVDKAEIGEWVKRASTQPQPKEPTGRNGPITTRYSDI